MSRSVIFIDPAVAGYQSLVAHSGANAEVFILDGLLDGVDQIAVYLAANSQTGPYDSVHIISHGSPGNVSLGNVILNAETLAAHADALSSIGSYLTTNGDILLYGCDIASGREGQEFIQQFATLTGADVAASDNATGPAFLGGDADLEFRLGDVSVSESPLGTQADFQSNGGIFQQRDWDAFGDLLTTYSSTFGVAPKGQTIQVVDGTHTFQVAGLPSGYTGRFYYSTLASSSLTFYGEDFINFLDGGVADFAINTTNLDLVQFDIYNSTGTWIETDYWNITRFSPYFYDVRIANRVDQDGDGYARRFDLEFDVDSIGSGQYYVRIYEDDGTSLLDDI
jgi:hypothetical protein